MSIAKSKHSSAAITNPGEKYTVIETLVNYYIVLMFTVFPLFFTNAYFNIRHDKYGLFLGLSLVLIIAEGALIAYARLTPASGAWSEKSCSAKQWYKQLSFPDRCMLALLLFCVISTLLSSHPYDSVFGTAGRNNGLLLMAVYAGIYFLITRLLHYKEYIFIALAVVSSVVFILAVLNCFYIDPLGMFANLTDEQTITDFTSTIGNKNLMSSFICIAVPVLVSLSVLTRNNGLRVLYLLSSGLGFAALMTSDSDSGILGLGVFLIIYFIWFVRNISRLKKYFLSITVMLAFGKLLRLFSYSMNDYSKGMDQFQEVFVYSNIGYVLILVFAAITALLYLIDFKKPNIILPKAVPITLGIAALVGTAGIICTIIYFSVIDTTTALGSFERLIRFNDSWGTHRGYMWIRSMWIFCDESFIKKLFGTGPDTFYYAFSPYFSELMKYGDSSTNAAHNEYINYLITIGVTGLASYLALVGGVITRAVKTAEKNPLAIICVAAVICYSVQAIVNISQPITTPLFIIFIALAEAFSRKTLNSNKQATI